MKRLRLALTALLAAALPLLAGPLQEARINQVVNDVKVIEPQRGAHPARLQEVIKDDLAVHTGIASRAELVFQDDTLTRLGAETFFTFKPGTRDLNLDRGTLLLQVPKNHGGAQIHAASVTASITGTTIMMEHLPAKSLKVVVLEGSLRMEINGHLGETMLLTPGKMVIMNPASKHLPEPVNVDLHKLIKTSALIDPKTFAGKSKAKIAVLPSLGLIEKEIVQQQQLVQQKGLVATNLVISGNGTNVVAASDETIARLDQGGFESSATTKVTATATQAAADALTTVPSGVGKDLGIVAATNGKSSVSTTLDSATTALGQRTAKDSNAPKLSTSNDGGAGKTKTVTDPGSALGDGGSGQKDEPGQHYKPISLTPDPTLPVVDSTGVTTVFTTSLGEDQPLDLTGSDGTSSAAPGAGRRLEAHGLFMQIGGEHGGVNLQGGSALLTAGLPGGDGGVLLAGTTTLPIFFNVEVDGPINASTGANASNVATGGHGGAVQIVTNGSVRVRDTITVSSAASGSASATGGTIGIRSYGSIKVENSGQLLSLLDAAAPGPGGAIKFLVTAGNVNISGGRVQADRGTVDIETLGGWSGITLDRATVAGDVVKIGALGANGQLIIRGGNISADTTLKLYAGTTNGLVRFTDDTTLGGAGAKLIAGRTVTIDNHKTVTISGSSPASVFTDHPNYTGSGGNGSTSGKFGGAGATTQPFKQTPGF